HDLIKRVRGRLLIALVCHKIVQGYRVSLDVREFERVAVRWIKQNRCRTHQSILQHKDRAQLSKTLRIDTARDHGPTMGCAESKIGEVYNFPTSRVRFVFS